MEILFSLKNINKTYGKDDGLVIAIKNLSLDIYDEEILAILGPSGCGKTTLLNILSGIDKIDSGEVLFKNTTISKLKEKELTKYRGENIGYIFQNFNLLDDLNVYSNIILPPSSNKDEKAVDNILSKLNLESKKYKFPNQLSGGEKQRVAIARAINKDSKVLLCDEPTGALDSNSGKNILSTLVSINMEEKRTIIIVTHTTEISYLADRIITMKNGEITSIKTNENKKLVEEINW